MEVIQMKVETSRFGIVEVEDSQVFTFPMGMLGFAKLKQYVVIDHTEDSPFKWLQSVEEGSLAFIITDPTFFRPDYQIKVRRGEVSLLKAESEDDLVVSVIMTIPDNPQDMTANLLAPLIFNMANRQGMQHVLTNSAYSVKFHVLSERDKNVSPARSNGLPSKAISLS
jgi:flagellar assembly factor FliW